MAASGAASRIDPIESDLALMKNVLMPTLFLFDVDNTRLDIDLTTFAPGAITV